MRSYKTYLAMAAVAAGFTVFAADVVIAAVVTFTPGGDTEKPYELTAEANWTPNAPGETDIIKINSGALGSDKLTLAADFAVAGVQVENPTQLLTIAPADTEAEPLPRLKIGECGITNETSQSSANGLSFTVPLETTAPQTWFAGKQLFKTASPIYGDYPLTIMRAYSVTHSKAPRYAGPITYKLSTYDWNQKVILQEAALWANAVTGAVDTAAGGSGYWQPTFAISGEWKLSDVFPEGMFYNANAWSVQTVLENQSSSTVTFDEGASSRMKFSGADSTHVQKGTLKIVDGANFEPGAIFTINTGATVQQTGGRVYLASSKEIRCGAESCESMGAVTYKLEGGVCTNYTTSVGGMKYEGWYPSMVGISRFKMSDGELVVLSGGSGYAASQALTISAVDYNNIASPGVFTQTGGRAIVNGVRFGNNNKDGNGAYYKSLTGFGYLNLCGGEMQLGNLGFAIGSTWNNGATSPDASNACYRVRLAGGALSVKNETTKLQFEVGDSETASVFSNATDHTVTAPVWGTGKLCKRGAGNLVFKDAARFVGPLVIEQGTVSVGAFSDPAPPATSPAADVALCADDIDGVEDGAAVEAWQTQDEAASATSSSQATSPTLVKGGFAGHNAVRFAADAKHALSLPNANIPWLGKKTLACAVVFRTKTKGPDSTWDIYGVGNRGRGIISTAAGNDNTRGTMFMSFTSDGAIAGRYNATDNNNETRRAKYNVYQRKPMDLDDGAPHIAIFSSDEVNLKLRTMVDGCLTEISSTLTSALDSTRSLLIGAMNTTEAGRYFDGDIAEVRLYGSTLSRAQMLALTEEWSAKYGVRPLTGRVFQDGEAPGSGLGSADVTIASGATLALPEGADAGYKVTAAGSFRNEGAVSGTLELEDGATLDLSWNSKATFGSIKASGTITIRVSDVPGEHSNRHDLFEYGSLVGNATFVLEGDGVNPEHDALVFDNGVCRFKTTRGSVFLLR